MTHFYKQTLFFTGKAERETANANYEQWLPAFEKFENYVAARLDYIVAATPFIKERFLAINKNSIDINNYPKLDEFDFLNAPTYRGNSICYIGGIEKIRGIVVTII
jgi:hypothetical protein